MKAPYCTPLEAGKQSEAPAVGRRIGRLLDSLGAVNTWVCQGDLAKHCDRIADCLRRRLRAEGWRITVNAHDCWQVLPPLPVKPARRPRPAQAKRRLPVWTVHVTVKTGTAHGLAWSGSVDVAALNSGGAMGAAREKLRAEVCPELWQLNPPPEVHIERVVRKEPRP